MLRPCLLLLLLLPWLLPWLLMRPWLRMLRGTRRGLHAVPPPVAL